jgi:hypothetical protein
MASVDYHGQTMNLGLNQIRRCLLITFFDELSDN